MPISLNTACMSAFRTALRLSEEEQLRRHRETNKRWYQTNKVTINAKTREWQKANKDKTRIYSQRRDARLKMLVLSHYSGPPPKCNCCGETTFEFLTIDHINGNGRAHIKELQTFIGYRGRTPLYRWLRNNDYPPGFRVLCHNCNFVLGHVGYCPHQNKERHNLLMSHLIRHNGSS